MAVITVQAAGTAAPDNWTLSAGASKQAAVNQPDDDATSYVDSTNVNGTQQRWTFSPALTTGDAISQVKLYVRYKRGAASDANFTLTYAFSIDGGGTQTGTSGTFTSTSSWQDGSYTHGSLSAAWGGSFTVQAENTQARRVQITTLYAEITYTAAAQTLTGAAIASTLAVHTPAMVTKKLAGAAIAATTALLAPAKVSFRLTAPTIAATTTLYPPSSVTIAGAVTTLTGAHIASTATLYAPAKINQQMTGAAIAATTALNPLMVHRGTLRIDNVTIVTATDVDSISFTHETFTGEPVLLLVFVARSDFADTTVISIPYNTSIINGDASSLESGATAAIYAIDGADEYTISVVGTRPEFAWTIAAISVAGVDSVAWGGGSFTILTDEASGYPSIVAANTNGLGVVFSSALDATGVATSATSFVYNNERRIGAALLDSALVFRGMPTAGTYTETGVEFPGVSYTTGIGLWIPEQMGHLYPPAWSSSTALTAPRVLPAGIVVDTPVIASGAALYAPAVGKIMAGATIASTAAVYTPAMITKRLAGAVISSTALHAPTVVAGTRTLAGATIAATVIYAPTVVPGGVTLAGATVAITPTVYTPVAMVVGGVTLTGRFIDITMRAYTPARVTATYTLIGAAIAATTTLVAPEVIPPTEPTPQTLTVTAAIASALAVHTPVTMTPGTVRLVGRSLDISTAFYAPRVLAITTLTGATIVSTVTTYAPSVAQVVTLPAIAATTALHAGQANLILTGAHIASTVALYPPVENKLLAGQSIASTVALYAPGVAVGAVTLVAPAWATTTTLYAGAMVPGGITLTVTAAIALTPEAYTPVAVLPGGVRLTGRPVDIGTRLYAGVVVNRRTVEPPLIASTLTLYAPSAATVHSYLLAPFIGCETPIGVNSPALINLMTLYAMTMLAMRLRGATIASGAATHTPTAVTSGPRVQTGDVFPPIEVDTV